MNLGSKRVIIMGETGAGRSSFINSVIGQGADKPATIGTDSSSCTENVEEFLYEPENGPAVSLLDTPGFGYYKIGSHKSESEILQMIDSFLNSNAKPEPTAFSGVVFLQSFNPSYLPKDSRKLMRKLKSFCNGQLNNVVVVTTRWDEQQNDETKTSEEAFDALLASNEFLNELMDAGVTFLRTGHFDEAIPQPPGDEYLSPLAIVKRLLGLEPDEEQTVSETNQGSKAGPPEQDLSRCMEQLQKTLEDLRTMAGATTSDRVAMNDDLQQRINKWESLLHKFCDQWKPWEDREKSLVASELESFAEKRRQELKKTHSEILRGQRTVGVEVAAMKQALVADQEERNRLSASWQSLREQEQKISNLQADKAALTVELSQVKSALAEQTNRAKLFEIENSSTYVSALRAQLQEMKGKQDAVEASKLKAEGELESTRKMLDEAKEGLGTRTQQVARLTGQVQAQAMEINTQVQRVTVLEAELEEGKERAQRAASLEAELVAEKRNVSALRAQLQEMKGKQDTLEAAKLQAKGELESTRKMLDEAKEGLGTRTQQVARLTGQVQAQAMEINTQIQRITLLEAELEKGKERAQRAASLEAELVAEKRNVSALRAQLQEMKGKQDVLEASRLKAKAELESTMKMLDEAKKGLGMRTQEVARLTGQVQAQAMEINSQIQRITLLEAELEQGKERAQRAASLEVELAAEKRNVSALRAQLQEMKGKQDVLEASRLKAKAELESTMKMFDEAKEGLRTRTQEVARLTGQVQAQAMEINTQIQRITILEAELKESKERAQRAASLEAELLAEKRNSEERRRESAHLETQLEDARLRIASLDAELQTEKQRLEGKVQELERRVRDRGSENEAHLRWVRALEMELKESKKKSEAQAQELTRLRREVQDQTTSNRRSANRITFLETELEKWKMKSEEQGRETTQLRGRIEEKITEAELHEQQIAYLQTNLEEREQELGLQTQESNRLKAEVEDLLAQCGTLTKSIGSLERQLKSYQNSPPQTRQPQAASSPTSPFGRVNSLRNGTPQRTASPVNQPTRFSGFSVSQSTPLSSPPAFPDYTSQLSVGLNTSSPYPAFTTNTPPAGNQPLVEPGFDPTLLQRNNQSTNWNSNFNYPSELSNPPSGYGTNPTNFHYPSELSDPPSGYGTNPTSYPSNPAQGGYQQGGNAYWYSSN